MLAFPVHLISQGLRYPGRPKFGCPDLPPALPNRARYDWHTGKWEWGEPPICEDEPGRVRSQTTDP
jgi:hypothetical protein